MKKIIILIFILFSNLNFAQENGNYQVLAIHPHDVQKIESHFSTIYKNGRLWIVSDPKNLVKKFSRLLKPLSGEEKSYFPKIQKKLLYNEEVIDITSQVNAEDIRATVQKLSRYKSRAAGMNDNFNAAQWIDQKFQNFGYLSRLECYEKQVCNVIAEKQGLVKKAKVLLVVAHFDSVGKDFAGADDNGSGVAVMLEMARILKDYQNKYTIRFLAANGEEEGLIGSKDYVKKLDLKGELSQIKLVINMDMVGYNQNGVVELETSSMYESLANWFSILAKSYTKLSPKITIGAWGSDHVSFLNKNVPSLLTIEDWSTKTPCYHKACDLPDTLNYDYASEIGKLNLAAILESNNEG